MVVVSCWVARVAERIVRRWEGKPRRALVVVEDDVEAVDETRLGSG